MTTPERLLDVEEAAELLRLAPATLRNWVSQRKIGFIKLGGKVLFRQSDLDRHVTSCFVEATTQKTEP
jgi:excisionase family DNA binding protein